LLGIFCIFGVFADTGKILRDFKTQQKNLLFESDYRDIQSEDVSIFWISQKLDVYNNIAESVWSQITTTKQKQQQLFTEILSLEQQIEQIEAEIQKTKNRVNNINSTIINIKNEIQTNKNTIQILKNKIDTNRETLYKYMVYIYKKSNYFSDEEDIDTFKSILLSWWDASEIINDLYFKWIIQVTWQTLIEKHRQFVSDLYIKRISLEKQEDNLKKMRKLSIIESKSLKDKKEFQNNILTASKGQDALYKKYIQDKVNIEKQLKVKAFKQQLKFNSIKNKLLDQYGCSFIDVSKSSVEEANISAQCLTLNKIIYSESQLESFSALDKNIFSWPIPPSYGLSAYFRDDGYRELFWDDHDALDIKSPQWSFIRAAADGYVTYVEPPETPDYSFLAIKHADGFTTVYGHLSEILVEELEFVEEGQIIAKSGWEVWTNGAGYLSTGPHLHFEVFQHQEYVDPMNYMDISYVSFWALPQKYHFKFYDDFKIRKWYEYKQVRPRQWNTFHIEWDTETQRQKSLITQYAAPAFRNWSMWVEESLDGNVDPSFVMCLWLAESWLGRNLKTPFNVWNVW